MSVNREVRKLWIMEVSVSRGSGRRNHRYSQDVDRIHRCLAADNSQKVHRSSNELHTTAQKIWAGVLSGGAFVVTKLTGDPLVADVATLRVGPFALIPPFVIVKLGQSLYGNESHV